jgi:septum formation protein
VSSEAPPPPAASPRLVLGSASPRRLELLAQIGVTPAIVRPADVDETPLRGELPRRYCERVTGAKLDAVEADPGDVVLCADTTVAAGHRILGKPADEAEARAFLSLLSGRRHRVVTTVALRRGERRWLRTTVSAVRLKVISEEEMRAYLAGGDWRGKAGGYAIQGPAAAFVPWIQGSYSGIMGLPLHETAMLLRAAGVIR